MFEMSLGENPSRRARAARGWLFGAAWMYPGHGVDVVIDPARLSARGGDLRRLPRASPRLVSPTGPWRVIGTARRAHAGRGVAAGLPVRRRAAGDAADRPSRRPARRRRALRRRDLADLGGVPDRLRTRRPVTVRSADGSQSRPARSVANGTARSDLWLRSCVVVLRLASRRRAPTTRSRRRYGSPIVQGGGPQGTRAINTDRTRGCRTPPRGHAHASQPGTADLVVWPENVIDVAAFAGSQELTEVAAEAARIGAPFAVGITEDAPDDHFINAQVVVTPTARIVSPLRQGASRPVRRVHAAARAAARARARRPISCHATRSPAPARRSRHPRRRRDGPRSGRDLVGGVLRRPCRARASTHGGTFILNPTNGSSYTGTILQSQQVASSRLRAIENGRWVVQVSPTGFSAFVSPDGDVFDRTVGQRAEGGHHGRSPLYSGRTWYSHARRHTVRAAGAAGVRGRPGSCQGGHGWNGGGATPPATV